VSGRLLTAQELSARWQVPKAWIYAKCRSGELPKVPLPGKYIRFREDTIEQFERGELDSDNGRA
jgi:predicted DNA-binding transcriptional regulator AlpA